MKFEIPRGTRLVTIPLVLLGLIYYLGVFRPNQKQLGRLRSELRSIGLAAGSAQQMSAKLAPLVDENEALKLYLATWEPRLAQVGQMSQALGRISELAERSGVSTTRLAPALPEEVGSLSRVPVDLELEGSFTQIAEFLRQLELEKQAIWIEQLDLNRPAEEDQPLRCQVKLVVFAG